MKRLLWVAGVLVLAAAFVAAVGIWRRSHPIYSPEQVVRKYIEVYGDFYRTRKSEPLPIFPRISPPDAAHFLPAATLVRVGAAQVSGETGTVPVTFVLTNHGKYPPEAATPFFVKKLGGGWLVDDIATHDRINSEWGTHCWGDWGVYTGSPIQGGER